MSEKKPQQDISTPPVEPKDAKRIEDYDGVHDDNAHGDKQ